MCIRDRVSGDPMTDANNLNADIAFELSPDPDTGYLRWQARSTAARAFSTPPPT